MEMATKKNNGGPTRRQTSGDDDGFAISATRTRAEGWVIKESGVVVVGRLLGRIKTGVNSDKTDKYSFQLRIGSDIRGSVPVRIVRGSGDDAQEDTVSDGIVNVDQNAALSELVEYCGDGNTYDVRIEYVGRTKGRDGNSYWDIDVRLRAIVKDSAKVPF